MKMAGKRWDFFISHASEDKKPIVNSLARELLRRGYRVWYDTFALTAGEGLRESIDRGLGGSAFGIVILSENFFSKRWPERELSALYAREAGARERIIIPLWHGIERKDVLKCSSTLADIVAIKTNVSLKELVDRITLGVQRRTILNLKDRIPTGIARLDIALRGGLPRPSSILIAGPKGIGKTTLAIQIQSAVLARGESGLYITYKESPTDILQRFEALQVPICRYIRKNKFRILDNFSARNDISKKDLFRTLASDHRRAIVRIDDPTQEKHYLQTQLRVMQEIGFGGVNVIDSVNDRYEMTSEKAHLGSYFQKFRTRLARIGKQSALHLASTDLIKHRGLNALLRDFQDGAILLDYDKQRQKRYVQIEALRSSSHDSRRMEFFITSDGLVLP